MPAKLNAYRCTECDFEFTVVSLNKDQIDSTNPYCPECGSDEYTSKIDCVALSLSERLKQYEIDKKLKPIPGVPASSELVHTPSPVYNEAISLLDPKWHETFLKFAETGEAPKEFLNYVDGSEKAQKAVEMIFRHQSAAMQRLSQALSKK